MPARRDPPRRVTPELLAFYKKKAQRLRRRPAALAAAIVRMAGENAVVTVMKRRGPWLSSRHPALKT